MGPPNHEDSSTVTHHQSNGICMSNLVSNRQKDDGLTRKRAKNGLQAEYPSFRDMTSH